MAAARAKKIRQEYLEAGTTFRLGQDVSIEVLNPKKGELPGAVNNMENGELDEVNNASLVLLLTYRNTRFLFTADIHREREVELIEIYGEKLRADFMDAPHHGIGTSSSQSFLRAVSPKVSVISYNKFNNYKQLLTYQKLIDSTYVTALHGNIVVSSDGKQLTVVSEKQYPSKGPSFTR